MKLLKVAAFAAIVVSGSALAGVVPQWGGGGNHNGGGNSSGPDSTLSIYQYGSANAALALQSDARKSETTITQSGYGNGADVGQGADNSTIELIRMVSEIMPPSTSGTLKTPILLSANTAVITPRWLIRPHLIPA